MMLQVSEVSPSVLRPGEQNPHVNDHAAHAVGKGGVTTGGARR